MRCSRSWTAWTRQASGQVDPGPPIRSLTVTDDRVVEQPVRATYVRDPVGGWSADVVYGDDLNVHVGEPGMTVNACRQAVLAEVEAYTARCDRPVATVHNVSSELLGVFTAAMRPVSCSEGELI